jgi:hypothetical protein
MYRVKILTIRPSAEVKFFPGSDLTKQHMQTMKDQGKLVEDVWELSEDGLTRTYTATWSSKEDYLAFTDIEELAEERWNRKRYNTANNIVMRLEEAVEV